MSHGGHSSHNGDHDDVLLPASPDIGTGGRLIVLLAILTSIMQGSFVAGSSHMMHVWPAEQSQKVPLPPFTATP